MDIFNSSNKDLKDDNFESIQLSENNDYEKKIFNNYDQKNNLNLENFNESSIEKYSNYIEEFENFSACPLVYGDKVLIYDTKRTNILDKKDGEFSFVEKLKHPSYYFIVSPDKSNDGKIVRYGDTFNLSDSKGEIQIKELGPYKDSGARALRFGPHRYGYTAKACAEATKGYKYFALQHGDATTGWCSADNDLKHATKYGTSTSCDRGPKGIRGGGKSGGPWCNYIYENIGRKKPINISSSSILYKQGSQVSLENRSIVVSSNPSLKLTNNFTVMTRFWQKERTNDWVRLIGKGNSNKRNYGLWIYSNGGSLAQIQFNQWSNVHGPQIPLKTWTHMALTFKKNGKHKLYINGKLVKEEKSSGDPYTDDEPLTLGGANFHSKFKGFIKDSYVFNTVLSDEQIKKLSEDSSILDDKNGDNSEGLFRMIPLSNSNKKEGDEVLYKDKLIINYRNKNIEAIPTKQPGSACTVKFPNFNKTGDYRIKRIRVRCDDSFEMYLDGNTYKGSGWNKTFTFENPTINDKKGFVIGFQCYNGGGPGGLIAEIELLNGSLIVTDNSWVAKEKFENNYLLSLFKTKTSNTPVSQWVKPNIIGLNQLGKKMFDGKKNSSADKSYTDSNFSKFANWIWAGPCMKSRNVIYLARQIGEAPGNEACSINLTYGQAVCYLERYPDIRKAAIMTYSNKYRYELNNAQATWWDHHLEARRRGGNLACFSSRDEERKVINKYLHKTPGGWGYWIGAYRVSWVSHDRGSRTWRWIDGRPWNYTNFWPNYEPNSGHETRLHVWKNRANGMNGTWNDLSSRGRLSGLYQFKVYEEVPLSKQVAFARKHWKKYGCKEGRTFDCLTPPATIGKFNYKGCYYDDYNSKVIMNDNGKVKSLAECADIAERNEERVFGLTDLGKCFTSNDIKKATKNGITEGCPKFGIDGKFQVYYRSQPFDPKEPKLSYKNFNDKKTSKVGNIENFENPNLPEKYELNSSNFSDKFSNKKSKYTYLIISVLLLVILFIYLYFGCK